MRYIRLESYSITPNQRLELKAERDVTGVLHRTTVTHTPSKIEFDTPYLYRADMVQLASLLRNSYTNALEKKTSVEFYAPDTDSYQTGEFYVPDVKFQIYNVDRIRMDIIYAPVRLAFIEY